MYSNVKMEIARVELGQSNNHTSIILKEKKGDRYLVIGVGLAEADAIANKLNNVASPRPLVYDLLCTLIQVFDGKVRWLLSMISIKALSSPK